MFLTIILWIYALGALALSVVGIMAINEACKSIAADDADAEEARRIMASLEDLADRVGMTVKGVIVLSAVLWPVTVLGRSIK